MKNFFSLLGSLFLPFVFSQLRKFAEAIPLLEMSRFAQKRIDDLEKLHAILTDKNPDNVAQLKKLYIEEREFFVDDSLVLAAATVRKHVQDPHLAELVASTLIDLANKELFEHRDGLVQNPSTAPVAKTMTAKRRTMKVIMGEAAAQAGEVKIEQPELFPNETPEQARLREGDETQQKVMAEQAEKHREELERKLASGEISKPTESLAADFEAAKEAEREPEKGVAKKK